MTKKSIRAMLASTMLVILLILGTLGAIWLGLCTPTEGAGVGAVGALILAVIKGIKPREVWQVVLDVGRTSGPLLLLLFCAQLVFARAVDDRLYGGRQDLPARHRRRSLGHPCWSWWRSGSCSAA